MKRWEVGSVTVTRIEEQLGYASFPPERYFAGFDRELLQRHLSWLVPNHYSSPDNMLLTSVHSWLIRTPQHNILVDCCAGNHKERPWWPRFHHLDIPFLERLRASGIGPEDIDIVLCTHLHADHIGWNTQLRDGRWVPTFPNARYLFSRKENAFWDPLQNVALSEDPARKIAYRDSVLPVIESGQAVLLDGVHAIDDSLRIEPAPGHTPGHVVLKLSAARGGGLFCGDVIHHPIQVYAPQMNTQFCLQPDEARASRRRVLEHCVEQRALLFPTHFGAPHVAAISAAGDAFTARFVEPV
jgi:glyoxylase-like metal-dependent hydrolase (beta-lactamase superfamily II)